MKEYAREADFFGNFAVAPYTPSKARSEWPPRTRFRKLSAAALVLCFAALPQAVHQAGATGCGASGISADTQDSGSATANETSNPTTGSALPPSAATVDLLLDMVSSDARGDSPSPGALTSTEGEEPVKPVAALTNSTQAEGSGTCVLTFDLETGDSGDLNLEARGGDSGDAFGGDAIGGDSGVIGIGGSVALGGQGGPGGSAGGSGAYAGAVIGNYSSGGGGSGGNGGPALCMAGPVSRGGEACSGGDVNGISGGGGDANGGKARSGNGGEAQAGSNSTGNTGDGRVAVDPLLEISLEP